MVSCISFHLRGYKNKKLTACLTVVSGSVLVFFAAQAEGVTELTQKGFIDWCRNGSGYERKHLYDDKKLNEAVQVCFRT